MKRLIQYILIAVLSAGITISTAASPTFANWDAPAYEALTSVNGVQFCKPIWTSNKDIYIFYAYIDSTGAKYLKYTHSNLETLQDPGTYTSPWSTHSVTHVHPSAGEELFFDATIDSSDNLYLVYGKTESGDTTVTLKKLEDDASSWDTYTVLDGTAATGNNSSCNQIAIDTYGDDYVAIALNYYHAHSSGKYGIRHFILNSADGSEYYDVFHETTSSSDYPVGYAGVNDNIDIAFDQSDRSKLAIIWFDQSQRVNLLSYYYDAGSYTEDTNARCTLSAAYAGEKCSILSDSNGYFRIAYDDNSTRTVYYGYAYVSDSGSLTRSVAQDIFDGSGPLAFLTSAAIGNDNRYILGLRLNSTGAKTYYKEKSSTSPADNSWNRSVLVSGESSSLYSSQIYLNIDTQNSLQIAYDFVPSSGADPNVYFSADDQTAPPAAERNDSYYGIGASTNHVTYAGKNYYYGTGYSCGYSTLGSGPTARTVLMSRTNTSDYVYTNSSHPSLVISIEAEDYFSGIDYARFIVDGSNNGSEEVSDSTGTFYHTSASTLSEGSHDWWVRTIDYFDNSTISSTYEVMVDTSAPSLEVTSPSPSDVTLGTAYGLVASTEATISFLAYDVHLGSSSEVGSGLYYFDYYHNSTNLGTQAASDAASYTYSLSGLNDGRNTFEVYAYDNVLNSRHDRITFLVDTYAPAISTTSTTTRDGGAVSPVSGTFSIAGIVSDVNTSGGNSFSGLKSVYVYLYYRNGIVSSVESSTELSDSSTSWDHSAVSPATTFNTTFTGLLTNTYTVEVIATDWAGHSSTYSMSFEVRDITPPTITIATPESGVVYTNNYFTTRFLVTDSSGDSGIRSIYLKTKQGSTTTTTAITTNETGYYSSNLSGLKDGALTLTIYATDCAGNRSYASSEVTIDLPDLEISYPAGGAALTQSWVTMECNNPAYDASGRESMLTSINVYLTNRTLGTTTKYNMTDLGYTTAEVARSATLEFTLDLKEGMNYISMEARDAVGNYFSANSGNFPVNLPDMWFISPRSRSGSAINLTDSNVTFEVYNPTYGSANPIKSMLVRFVNSAGRTTTLRQSSTFLPTSEVNASQPITFTYGLSNETYTVSVYATDEANNLYSTSETITVNVTGPTLEAPTVGQVLTNSNITFEVYNPLYGAANPVTSAVIKIGRTTYGVTSEVTGGSSSSKEITLANGTYTATFEARDAVGNTFTNRVTFDVNVTGPSFVLPLEGRRLTDSNVDFLINNTLYNAANPATSAVVRIGRTSYGLTTEAINSATPTFEANLVNGSYTATLEVTDAAGNSFTDRVTFEVNVTGPSFSAPTAGQTLTSSNVSLRFINPLFDCVNPITRATVRIGRTTYGITTEVVGSRASSFEVDLANGNYTATLEAVDAVGNSFTDRTTFEVAVRGIVLITPAAMSTITTNYITVECANPIYDHANPMSAVSAEVLYLEDGTKTSYSMADLRLTAAQINSGATFTFNRILPLLNGAYRITVEATDAVGNYSTDTAVFLVDLPEMTMSTSSLVTSSEATVTCTNPVAGNVYPLVGVSATVANNGTVTSYPMASLVEPDGSRLITAEIASSTDFSLMFDLLEGDNIITVTATDTLGNTFSTAETVTVALSDMAITLPSTSTSSRITVEVSNPVYGSANPLVSVSASVRHGTSTDAYSMSTLGLTTREAVTSSSLSFELNVYDGNNIISVEAQDSLGNSFTAVGVVRVNLPDIEITSPESRSIYNTSSVTVKCTNGIYGSVNPLASLTAQVNHGGTVTSYSYSDLGLTAAAISAESIQFNLTLSDGLNNITVEATDSLSNTSRDSVLILVDTQAPAISLDTPSITTEVTASSITWLPSISGTVSDTNEAADVISGLSNIAVAIYSGTSATGTAAFAKTYYADTSRTFGSSSTYLGAQSFSDELDEIAITDSDTAATYTMVVTASDFAGNTTTETTTFTITPDATSYISSLSASPSSVTIEAGSSVELAGYIYGYYGSVAYNLEATDLTWSVDGRTYGSIDTDGTFASNGTSGSAVVSASINGYSASVTVNIIPATLASIAINPSSVEVNNGETASFTLTGYDTYGNAVTTDISDYPISWSISDSSAGTLTVPTGAYNTATLVADESGSYTLTASYTNANGTMTDSATITISLVPISRIEISGSTSLIAGDDYTMTVKAYESDGTEISDLSVYAFTWSLSSGGTLSSSTGSSVTLTAGETAGTYTLSLACDYSSSLTDEATLTIFAGESDTLITDPDLSTGTVSLTYGDTQTISVTALDEYSNPSTIETVTIDSTDTSDGVLYGNNSITIEVGGITETYTYTVIPDITSVEVSAADAIISAGEQLSISFEATDSLGSSLSLSDLSGYGLPLSWSSTGGSISSAGLFTAPSTDGEYTVTVSYTNDDDETISSSVAISVSSGGPTITLSINDEEFDASDNYIVNEDSSISIDITDANEVVSSSVTVALDGTSLSDGSGLSISGADSASVDSLDISVASTTIAALAEGSHTLTISATDATGASSTSSITFTFYDSLSITDTPINYPNPFSPADGTSTTIRYTLSQDADITFMIYDLVGNRLYRYAYSSGSTGGSSGQNEITWNGYTSSGSRVGNGVYIYFILSGTEVLGSGEMAVYN